MVILPQCPCCGGGTTDCWADQKIAVYLANLPHENKYWNISGNTNGMLGEGGTGVSYLDDRNGEYVLYKASEDVNGYTTTCKWLYSEENDNVDQYDRDIVWEILYTVTFESSLSPSGPRWQHSLQLMGNGGIIVWSSGWQSGSLPAAVPSTTFTNSDITVNNSPESYYYFGIYLYYPWTLTGTSATVQQFDAVTHAAAVEPCECYEPYDPPSAGSSISYPLYKSTCMADKGTPDPGSTRVPVYSVNPRHDESTWCNYVPIYHTATPANASPGCDYLEWYTYGSDELEVDIGDLVRGGTTLSTAGTYTLAWSGETLKSSSASSQYGYSCANVCNITGSSIFYGYVGANTWQYTKWAGVFQLNTNATDYLLAITVSLGRFSTYSSRRIWLTIGMSYASGLLLVGEAGTNMTFVSDGLQGEDNYVLPGTMPTVTGNNTGRAYTCCYDFNGGWSTNWNWTVRQA